MKKLILLSFIFMTSLLFAAGEPPSSFQKANIRLLLENETKEALLEVRGPYHIFNPYDGTRVSSGLIGKRFIVRPTPNGLRWGGEFPGVHQIAISPRSPECSILLNGTQYSGNILVYKIGNKINIVNEVSVEDYIKSRLTDEFTLPLEPEVMASVAIAERTTAYFHVSKNSQAAWHLTARDLHYTGSALVLPDSHIVQAVDATKDLILVNPQNGRNVPFAACWTEHSAGKTAPFNTIFRKDMQAPPTGTVSKHAALDREESKWNLSLPKHEIARLFHLSENIQAIETFRDPSSGKIYAVRIRDESKARDVDFFTFQEKVGKERLLSNDFSVDLQHGKVIFTGFGKGHGVGICLYTASAMAQNGEMAVKILSTFFPDTFLINLSATPQVAENK